MATSKSVLGAAKKMFDVGNIVNAYFTYDAYKSKREEGSGVARSLLSGTAELAMLNVMGNAAYMATWIGPDAGGMIVDGAIAAKQYSRQLAKQGKNVPFGNATFVATEQVATMRQAGMYVAKRGAQAAQAAMLGNEAKYLHR